MLFDEDIKVEGTRGNRKVSVSLPACLVDDGIPADSAEGHLIVGCDQFTFFINAADWADTTDPQAGDVVTDARGRRYAVTRASRLGPVYAINSRSI